MTRRAVRCTVFPSAGCLFGSPAPSAVPDRPIFLAMCTTNIVLIFRRSSALRLSGSVSGKSPKVLIILYDLIFLTYRHSTGHSPRRQFRRSDPYCNYNRGRSRETRVLQYGDWTARNQAQKANRTRYLRRE